MGAFLTIGATGACNSGSIQGRPPADAGIPGSDDPALQPDSPFDSGPPDPDAPDEADAPDGTPDAPPIPS
jgi:hypothetical protein